MNRNLTETAASRTRDLQFKRLGELNNHTRTRSQPTPERCRLIVRAHLLPIRYEQAIAVPLQESRNLEGVNERRDSFARTPERKRPLVGGHVRNVFSTTNIDDKLKQHCSKTDGDDWREV